MSWQCRKGLHITAAVEITIEIAAAEAALYDRITTRLHYSSTRAMMLPTGVNIEVTTPVFIVCAQMLRAPNMAMLALAAVVLNTLVSAHVHKNR
eukprot:2992-Heterococcus_DN1.PRE.2